MKRHRSSVDLRPDWRDPNMPLWVSRVNRWVTPEEMQRAAQKGMRMNSPPKYDKDPTYFLAERKSK